MAARNLRNLEEMMLHASTFWVMGSGICKLSGRSASGVPGDESF